MILARIQCVLVLYKTTLQASETFVTLCAAARSYPELAARIDLLIYDNSPTAQPAELPENFFAQLAYRHDGSNGGLAVAYNEALSSAQTNGCAWLWLFDQDTSVVPELLPATFAAIDAMPPAEVCGIVPRLVQGEVMLSPVGVERLRYRLLNVHVAGLFHAPLTALNSCACLRVEMLQAIGGFPAEYWLDFLDHAVFHRLHARGGRLLVLDVTIPHRLSTNNLSKESSPQRFDNMHAAEWRFVRESGWGGGTLLHRLRLLKRALRTLVTLREPGFALQVLKWSLR